MKCLTIDHSIGIPSTKNYAQTYGHPVYITARRELYTPHRLPTFQVTYESHDLLHAPHYRSRRCHERDSKLFVPNLEQRQVRA